MPDRELMAGIICWLRTDGDLLPDDETTVLLYAPGNDEPVWPGWLVGDAWYWSDGMPANGVTHWTGMPEGPNPKGPGYMGDINGPGCDPDTP